MQLSLPEDSSMVKEMFERFFSSECTTALVRDAEPVGFHAGLWKALVELETPFMRTTASLGGGDMSLFDTCLVMEEAGRRLAPVPLAETLVALRILSQVGGEVAARWVEKVRDGETILSLALHKVVKGKPQLVPGGAVARGILTFDGEQLAIEIPPSHDAPHTLGGNSLGTFHPGTGTREVLATNADAASIWSAGIEEWKILTAAALVGLTKEALAMAAAYANERFAFGVPIGVNQGLAHPLANDVIDADGASYMLWWVLRRIDQGMDDAGALISMLSWFASRTASISVAHALHTFGGYGLSDEYDIQLYHRRAKSWAQALGDPLVELERGGRRLLLGETTSLPEIGEVPVNFEGPDTSTGIAAELRDLFGQILDPVKHRLHEYNFEAHDWDVHRAIGEAGLLFPEWEPKWGGRGASIEEVRSANQVWIDVGYAGFPRGVTGMAGHAVQAVGSQELKDEVLLAFARGEKVSCLGFTEPSGGSDVFAAKTRAVKDGDEWVINGQKMFTSGAELSDYVLLLTRTDPDAPKHKGLTMFLCPLKQGGVEIHPVETFMDERTNATFYEDVRIPDRYRLGEVNGGARVMAMMLTSEQGGTMYHNQLREMVARAAIWARAEERDGKPLIEHSSVLTRLARTYSNAAVAEALNGRVNWAQMTKGLDLAYGPAAKVFATEAFIADSADLVDLAAPFSLLRGKSGLGAIEMGYRHSTATTIYAGTSEVLRSMVAERRLGLPRSRA